MNPYGNPRVIRPLTFLGLWFSLVIFVSPWCLSAFAGPGVTHPLCPCLHQLEC